MSIFSIFTKNTNYNPNDPNSNRYVSPIHTTATPITATQLGYKPVTIAPSAKPITIGGTVAKPTIPTSIGIPGQNMTMANLPPLSSAGTPTIKTATTTYPTTNTVKPTPTATVPTPTIGGTTPTKATIGALEGTQPQLDQSTLATLAGKAGMSPQDFLKSLGMNSAPDAATQNGIRNSLGIPTVEASAYAKPSKTSQAIYNDAYNTSGLGDIKNKIADIDKTIEAKRLQLTKNIKAHQDNPWLSQETRSARIANEEKLAIADIQTYVDSRTSYLDQYDKGVTEIEKMVGRITGDEKLARDLSADHLNYLLNEAERQTGVAKTEGEKQNLRYLPDFLKSSYAETINKENRATANTIKIANAKSDNSGAANSALLSLQNMGIDVNDPSNKSYATLAKSAGGKATTDTFRTTFEKGLSTLYQLSDLNKAFTTYNANTGKDVDEETGPIMGIIRSSNPYDVKAQAIQAQLTALVPQLARGIYGEVGVLTNQDVELYKQTIPNLKSTTDVRNALLAITARSVQRALENKLLVQANGGVDVSGFIPMLQDIQNTTGSMLSRAGVGQTDKAKADAVSAIYNGTGGSASSGNDTSLDDLWNSSNQ